MNIINKTGLHRFAILGLVTAGLMAGSAVAQDDKKPDEKKAPPMSAAQTLEQLLQQTRDARAREAQANAAREQRFLADRNGQAAELAQATRERDAQEARSKRLGAEFDANEKRLTELQAVLDSKGGNLGELFGTVRVVAGDVSSVFYNSMITTRYPDRDKFVAGLSQVKSLPSIDELEKLWFEMQREMTETGRTVRFKTKVVDPDGTSAERESVMIGGFTAVSEGEYLTYLPSEKALAVLARQPEDYLGQAEDVLDADEGYVEAVVDPSRGTLMALYLLRPTVIERIEQGELVGLIIILVGLAGAGAAIYQFLYLIRVRRTVKAQLTNLDRPTTDNPLGRVLATFKGDAAKAEEDAEVVELRISEAVLREVPPLERYQSFLRLAVAAGPLLGLVGTVIGMIITFQSITESGSGDPRLMAAGIGQAMIATVLGLGIAIPLLFANAWLTSLSKQIVQILDEQSTGMLAERLEKQRRA
jgi:biopolymer transport protein ExbB